MAEMASIVNWYGPYSDLNSARAAARIDYVDGLYAAIGYNKDSRVGRPTLQYVGVGSPLHTRLSKDHHKLSKIDITSIWLGEVSSFKVPGRRKKKIEPHLDTVEWSIAYFLRTPKNVNKRKNPPPQSCIVLNRWLGRDYETPMSRPIARWSDIIEYDEIKNSANLCWLGESSHVKHIPDVVEYGLRALRLEENRSTNPARQLVSVSP